MKKKVMQIDKNGSFSTPTTSTFTPKSVNVIIPSTTLKAMDLTSPKHFNPPPSGFDSHHGLVALKEQPLEGIPSLYRRSSGDPFADTFTDPLCKLNLKETSEFVKSFPVANSTISVQRRGVSSVVQKRPEAPSTPGRPLFSFSVGNGSRKSFPSKWDDAEKWLISSSCHDSPAHPWRPPPDPSKGGEVFAFADKCRVTQEKVTPRAVAVDHHGSTARPSFNGVSDVLLQDKFTDNVDPIVPNFIYSEPSKEGFVFRNPTAIEAMKNASTEVVHDVHHRDIGTEMTPLGSSTTSRCHTPFKSSSPARHNTPSNRSGLLAMVDSDSTMEVCHLAKLQLGRTQHDSVASNWSSKEEEEEEISKSLRHFDTSNGFRRSVSESRAAAWEEEEKTKRCLRYQREEAKIQAWVNLQNAKAEAQSRKLEVKIQKMRSELEEKLMKRMASVQRKAEEWRISAQQQHAEQVQRAEEQVQKMMNRHSSSKLSSSHRSCGCFPCNKP